MILLQHTLPEVVRKGAGLEGMDLLARPLLWGTRGSFRAAPAAGGGCAVAAEGAACAVWLGRLEPEVGGIPAGVLGCLCS